MISSSPLCLFWYLVHHCVIEPRMLAAAFGAFFNQGQICMSTERLIVDAKVADDFVARLATKIATLPAGNPNTEGSVLGSLVDSNAGERIKLLIDDALDKGATLVAGGQLEGSILQPTLLDGVTDARCYWQLHLGW